MNAHAHEERMQRTGAHFGFAAPGLLELERGILEREMLDQGTLEREMLEREKGKVKCRVVYRETIEEITFERYLPKRARTLKLIEASPNYSFKYTDRQELNALLAKKDGHDEILITRNGLITDTSYSNVVLRQGDLLFTPATPLLNGTKRQKLLQEGIIRERDIHRDALPEYDRLYLINAMLDMEDEVSLPTHHILL